MVVTKGNSEAIKAYTYCSCKARIAGEMYEAVTRCFSCFRHSCATAGWNGTGSRLRNYQHGQVSCYDARHSPDNKVSLFNQLGDSRLVVNIDEDS